MYKQKVFPSLKLLLISLRNPFYILINSCAIKVGMCQQVNMAATEGLISARLMPDLGLR